MTKHDNVSQGEIMKATEFVKKFGWDSLLIAKTLPKFNRYKYVIFYVDEIDFSNEFIEKHKDYMFESQDLKRLVESHELVESYSGLVMAKRQLSCFLNASRSVGINPSPRVLALQQAIADVEACQ